MDDTDETVVKKDSLLYKYMLEQEIPFEVMDEKNTSNHESVSGEQSRQLDEYSNIFLPPYKIPAEHLMLHKEFIERILNSQLLFDEDSQILEMCHALLDKRVFSNRIRKKLYLRLLELSSFVCGTGIMYKFRHPLVQFSLLAPALAYIGYYLTYKYNQYQFTKEFSEFIGEMTKLHKALKKSLQLTRDCSKLYAATKADKDNLTSSFIQYFEGALKSILIDAIKNVHQCTLDIKKVVDVNAPNAFSSINDVKPEDSSDLIKLSFAYLYTQSQCLRILGMSYCSNFWNRDTYSSIKLLHRTVLNATTRALREIYLRLESAIYLFRNNENLKRPPIKCPYALRLPQRDIYTTTYRTAVHLHSCVPQMWNVVSLLETEVNEARLRQLQNKFDSLISDLTVAQEYLNHSRKRLSQMIPERNNVDTSSSVLMKSVDNSSSSMNTTVTNSKVIDTEAEQQSADQIYELYIKKDDDRNVEMDVSNDTPDEDEKKTSQLLLKELEKAIEFKRDEWEQREAKIREHQKQQPICSGIISGTGYDPTNSESCDETKRISVFKHKTKKVNDTRQSESSSSEDKDKQYFGARNTSHVLPHPRRISKYKNVRDKATKQKQAKLQPPLRWDSTKESNDDSSDMNIPSHPIGFGKICLPSSVAATFQREDEESLSAVGELSDSDSEQK